MLACLSFMIFCLFYVIFLLRTVFEIYIQGKSYSIDLMSKLSNGLVLPVVQLLSAFLIHRKNENMSKSTKQNLKRCMIIDSGARSSVMPRHMMMHN